MMKWHGLKVKLIFTMAFGAATYVFHSKLGRGTKV